LKITEPGNIGQIIIDCWDYDLAKTHDFLGQIIIDPSTLELKKKLKFQLYQRPNKKEPYVKGNIEIIFDINQKDTIEEHKLNIFGVSMTEVMERGHETEKYPKQVKTLIDFLVQHGPKVEGIFRKSASVSKVKSIVEKLDLGEELTIENTFETFVTTVAALFKMYLRELPDPILTWELYDDFIKASALDKDKKLLTYARMLTDIPFFNRGLLYDLMTLCNLINDKKDTNLMHFKNLAVIFGVCLLQSKDEATNMKDVITVQQVCIDLMEMHPKHFELAEKIMEEEDN
jgi:hypothetical protein